MWLVLVLILTGFLILAAFIDSKSAIGMIGITIGALISGFFSYFISETNYRKQLRLAALDRRLETHQQAFSLWWDIRSNIFTEEKLSEIIQNATNWWQKNCLFLGPKSRSAFYACLIFAANHADLVKYRTPGSEDKKEIRESWDIIMLPGKTLVEEMALPSLADETKIPEQLENQ